MSILASNQVKTSGNGTTSNGAAVTSLPSWVEPLSVKYISGVAHSFILHFNVNDVIAPGVTLPKYLLKLLMGSPDSPLMDVIVYYDRARGIQFPLPSMKQRFVDVLGLAEKDQEADAMLSAITKSLGTSNIKIGDKDLRDDVELPRQPGQALPLIDRLLHTNKLRSAVVVFAAETIVPEADVAVMSPEDRTNLVTISTWGNDPEIAKTGNIIVLVTGNLTDIHSQVRAASSKFESILVDLPDYDRRLAFIRELAAKYDFDWQMTREQLANLSAGLSLVHIHDIVLRAAQQKSLTHELVKERKDDILASEFGEVIEVMEPRFGFEAIGGLDHVKSFFSRSVIKPLREGNRERAPMGVLMTGPAGTGKSAMAEAVAKEAGVNAVSLNLAKIFGQYVGNSERNLEKALRAIKSLAPAIVFIDEIDQSVRRGEGGDSGVSNRIFKRLLEFMSDTGNRGRIVFLAATNRPDLLDAALRRPGRFDRKIPFLVPSDQEREHIVKVMALRYGLGLADVPAAVVANTQRWTGAELEAATVKAIELVYDEDLTPAQAMVEATRRLSPSTADIDFMTMIAIRECNDLDLLPESYRALLVDRSALDAKIEEAKPRGRQLGL